MQDSAERIAELKVVEICAGAGGQSLGLHRAGFRHQLAVELDENAHRTLRLNIKRKLVETGMGEDAAEKEAANVVRLGDVASLDVWNPADFEGVDLLAGGVPCPPFSIAGKQLGANDERDLFAWAVELCGVVRPRALMLENVRGLSSPRFSAYRQHVLDRLDVQGYVGEWRLLEAKDFGVPQLRPRFVLVALKKAYAKYFEWPDTTSMPKKHVGPVLRELMKSNGWDGADSWADGAAAEAVAPTIVGGSKKHGGADLGPTRAKRAWAALGVDAMGVADEAPPKGWAPQRDSKGNLAPGPKLTTEMVALLQGWGDPSEWEFTGRKTSRYRQIGNAFPPPVAEAVGRKIAAALRMEDGGEPVEDDDEHIEDGTVNAVHDPVYLLLRAAKRAMTAEQIAKKLAKAGTTLEQAEVESRINHIRHDFEVETKERPSGDVAFRLREFKAFIGQQNHARHDQFAQNRSRIS